MIWVVDRVVGGPVWCPRRKGDDDATHSLNAGSPLELTEQLEAEN